MKSKTAFSDHCSWRKRRSSLAGSITGSAAWPSIRWVVRCHSVR